MEAAKDKESTEEFLKQRKKEPEKQKMKHETR